MMIEIVVDKLQKEGIDCYIWHKATTGSSYIRFNDPRIGSIRIADHKGREKLKYKFNLMTKKYRREGWYKDGKVWRYYSLVSNYKQIIPIVKDRAEQVKQYEQREYYVPHFKKQG